MLSDELTLLGIETSCDETAVAVVSNGEVVYSKTISQVDLHAAFGGVLPEAAARRHLEVLPYLLEGVEEPDLVAFTAGPGLLPALLAGASVATGLAKGWNVPLLGVNHVVAHLAAVTLEQRLSEPVLGLVVSGGHSSFYLIEDWRQPALIGWTYDDAAGEALDKVGRALGLSYPAGPVMDQLAWRVHERIPLPLPLKSEDSFNFSFSGLKTAVLRLINKAPREVLAASMMEAVADHILERSRRVLKAYPYKLIVGGGVSASSYLRHRLSQEFGDRVLFPSVGLSTDNAIMIAWYAKMLIDRGVRPSFCVTPDPDMETGYACE
ncbi:tRNA (adenosine(37)-N6)-threonylcarbamoyltransferase complex transferase subunit TsaD [Coprothermobacteraceae bacterium]|nr:tRNA (adenosine(37)-N6)-threonylcarbamoyltransferase complex transferase subunit TsaD [Coprothermobacteraceae bacterium]